MNSFGIGKAALKAVANVLRGGGKALSELMAKKSSVAEQVIIDTISGALYDLGVPLSVARTVANVFTFLAF
ncbi:hypothetical protein [Paenibacillus pinihumi]|uniref:hypothetical protein n=1 Tax=Paenibacillus pinihumi TaxID=669462 RepID=UPI0003FD4BA6|nr:hypothetical protein [Paenibacillus pinihumi]